MFDLVPLDDEEINARKIRKELANRPSQSSLSIALNELGFENVENEIPQKVKTQLIADRNDLFRKNIFHPKNGKVVVTQGINALGFEMNLAIMREVARFNDFTKDNNPHGERDMGMFEFAGNRIMWKIDYYDLSYRYGSEDPSNVLVTNRVLTIMLASEY